MLKTSDKCSVVVSQGNGSIISTSVLVFILLHIVMEYRLVASDSTEILIFPILILSPNFSNKNDTSNSFTQQGIL